MPGTFTYDIGTDRGKVRLLINDTDTDVADNQCFQDAEVDAFLAIEPTDVRLAAALALDTMAASSAWIDKKVSLMDFTIDGPAVAASLADRAEKLRCRVFEDDDFDWAEQVLSDDQLGERLINEWLRTG
jgi:hypothetical protein